MTVFPPGGSDKLGLVTVLGAVRERVVGESTVRLIERWPVPDGLEAVRLELRKVEELAQAMDAGDRVPLDALPDVRGALASAAPEGAALALADLADLALITEVGMRVQGWFSRGRDRCPLLRSEVIEWTPPEAFAAAIRQAVDENGEIRDQASPELRRLRRELVQVQAAVREAAHKALRAASSQGYAAEEQPTIRAGRVVIPVRAEARRKVPGFVHDVSASGQTVYIEPTDSLEGNNRVRELELEERREVERIRRQLTAAARAALPHLTSLFFGLEHLDFRIAKARMAVLMEATRPEVEAEGVIRIAGARNPALFLHFLDTAADRCVVPLDLELGVGGGAAAGTAGDVQEGSGAAAGTAGDLQKGSGAAAPTRTIIISGPNAGGKSVAMKTIGLLAVMTGMGMLIPIDPGGRFDLFDQVFVDIGDEQSLADDLSTFTSHLRNLAHFTSSAGPGTLVLIDEAGTGTDPEAGGAIAQAVIERLTQLDARTVVTTHYGSLKAFAHHTPHVVNASMLFDQEQLAPTYVFRAGVPGSSYASEIADRVGLDPRLTARARELMGSGHTGLEQLIEDLVRRGKELEEQLDQTYRLKVDAEKARQTMLERIERLQSERERIRSEALENAQAIVRDSNAVVERAVREIRESGAAREATAQVREELEHLRKRVEKQSGRTKRKSRTRRPPENEPVHRSSIAEGDRVRLEDGQTAGEVLSIDGKEALVAFGSMQMRTGLDRLVKVGGPREQQVQFRHAGGSGGKLSVQDVKQRIDLRGQRVDEALSQVRSFLDRAMGAGLDRADILHGKGTGALRGAIHEYLASESGIRDFSEAPIEEGGAGVTIVYFA